MSIIFSNGFSIVPHTIPNPDGLTPATAGVSAFQIKTDYPNSTNGLYWIKNDNIDGGTPFQIYADMTTFGGGWTLIMTNVGYSGWTYQNAILRNESSPVISGTNYSIISYADYIKRSGSTFQYMIEANERNHFGAIWSAPQSYTFVKTDNTQTNVNLDIKFGTWDYYENGGISQRMPWHANSSGFITTSTTGGGFWWGTLITDSAGWVTAPWMSNSGYCGSEGCMGSPSTIWYWVR
jgi:hypothetical protein